MFLFSFQQGDDGWIGEYTGSRGINENLPVYTEGEALYVEFYTDVNTNHTGFQLAYTAVCKLDIKTIFI